MVSKVVKRISQKYKKLPVDQRLRLRRFRYAIYTYAVVTLATMIFTSIGLGEMSKWPWIAFIGLGVIGNLMFATLFITGANLNFSDPSLTLAQIVYSALWGMIPIYSLPEARPIVLMFYLPAFSFGMLRLSFRQYLYAVLIVMSLYALILVLTLLHNPQDFRFRYELFLYVLFGILLTWFAIFGGFVSNLRRTLRQKNQSLQRARENLELEIKERKGAQLETDSLVTKLQDALDNVNLLSGLLPICASCKKIRDDQGNWKQIEIYIRDRSEADFSHGICPDCLKDLYPEFS